MPDVSFFQWCESSALGSAIKTTSWAFAVIESIHLLGLALIGGTVIVLNLRLLGFGFREYSLRDFARELQPWFAGSLILMLCTGFALFLSEAVKCYYSQPFWIKMASLVLAILFTTTVQRHVVLAAAAERETRSHKAIALISLALWFCVGASGRWIGFSG